MVNWKNRYNPVNPAFAVQPMAMDGQRCAATDSSSRGSFPSPFSTTPSTEVRADEDEARR